MFFSEVTHDIARAFYNERGWSEEIREREGKKLLKTSTNCG